MRSREDFFFTVLIYFLSFVTSYHIFIVTHSNELSRIRTNTGRIVSQSYNITSSFTWSGRNDNQRLQEAIIKLTDEMNCTPTLLWTTNFSGNNNRNNVKVTENLYIVIDGTWQEAKKVYRKGPGILREICSLSLSHTDKSKYSLRSNYGYMKKFSSSSTSNLLCTAEVCAEIMKIEGDMCKSEILLSRLEQFQIDFNKNIVEPYIDHIN